MDGRATSREARATAPVAPKLEIDPSAAVATKEVVEWPNERRLICTPAALSVPSTTGPVPGWLPEIRRWATARCDSIKSHRALGRLLIGLHEGEDLLQPRDHVGGLQDFLLLPDFAP